MYHNYFTEVSKGKAISNRYHY